MKRLVIEEENDDNHTKQEAIAPNRVTFDQWVNTAMMLPDYFKTRSAFHANSEYMEYRQEAYMQLVEKIKLMDYKLLNRENELRKIGRNLTTATEVIRFYGERETWEYKLEGGRRARKWLEENDEQPEP